MFIADGISLKLSQQTRYEGYRLAWVFAGNSSCLSFDSGAAVTSTSEPWLTQASDQFAFDAHGRLVHLRLQVPNRNAASPDISFTAPYTSLMQRKPVPHVEPMSRRHLDVERRLLTCWLPDVSVGALSAVKLDDRLALLSDGRRYAGFQVQDPLPLLTGAAHVPPDWQTPADAAEYRFMKRYLQMLSDERLEALGDDMERLIAELCQQLRPRLMEIASAVRRSLLERSLAELEDFYC